MENAKCPKCGNPNIGLIREGSEYFLKKHKRSNGKRCGGSFLKVDK